MSDLPRPKVILDILQEHFEELDFLWEQRERVVFAPDWTLSRLAELEERAEAHLDGLRIGLGHSVDIARPFLAGKEQSAATAAAFVFLAMERPELDDDVLSAFARAGDARDGIRIALRHSPIERLRPGLTSLATAGDDPVRVAALDVLAFHRAPAPGGFLKLFAAPDPVMRASVYASAGRLGGPWSADVLQEALKSADGGVRRSALYASARLGLPGLAAACRSAIARSSQPLPDVLEFLGVVAESEDIEFLKSVQAVRAHAPGALGGLGAAGDIAAVPAMLAALRDPGLVLPAGAAFVRITGATGIEASAPLPPPAGLTEEELDLHENIVPVDPERAELWWQTKKSRFAPEGRWQFGIDIVQLPFAEVSRRLPLSIRRDVYLARRVRNPERVPDLEFEARTRLQRADF